MSGKLMGATYGVQLERPLAEVLRACADHADEHGWGVFPSVALLAWKLDVDRRTVQRRLKRLRELGVLIVVRLASRHRPTEYRIALDALEPKPPFRSGAADAPSTDDWGDTPDAPTDLGAASEGLGAAFRALRGGTQVPPGAAALTPEPSIEPSHESPDGNGLANLENDNGKNGNTPEPEPPSPAEQVATFDEQLSEEGLSPKHRESLRLVRSQLAAELGIEGPTR